MTDLLNFWSLVYVSLFTLFTHYVRLTSSRSSLIRLCNLVSFCLKNFDVLRHRVLVSFNTSYEIWNVDLFILKARSEVVPVLGPSMPRLAQTLD
jgi:hypothetical protein